MIDLNNISRIYFVGIGGIGMSALAKYFSGRGITVSGYDRTTTPLTEEMESNGIRVHYEDDIALIDKEADLIIYTPAIPADHKGLQYYTSRKYPVYKRSEVLGEITSDTFNICVAGTHGKTTVSSMIAHILHDSGYGCTAFLGGISVNYNTNFFSSNNNVCVVEADEYDRSFLRLKPAVAVITAMDADHLDIYGSKKAMQDAFIEFSEKLSDEGLLLSKYGLERNNDLRAKTHLTYSLQNDAANIYAADITISNGSYKFDYMQPDWMMDNVILNMGGMHNVENAVAAISVARYLKIDREKIRKAVSTFRGVKRRFEYIIPPADGRPIFIDDYAHHPEELKALINGARTLFHDRKCTVIFQPHLYTRTRDLTAAFAESLDLADEVILLPIYPARELPIEGVESDMILSMMKNSNTKLIHYEELLNWIKQNPRQLVITAGAGDIDQLVEPIKEILITNNK